MHFFQMRAILRKSTTLISPRLGCLSQKGFLSSTDVKEVLIYNGNFAEKLRSIRRVSILSSIVSSIGFPIAISVGASTVMPLAGQIAMASTIIITSLSSTLFLQLVCHPYVVSLHELVPVDKAASTSRKFKAIQLSVFGRDVVTTFSSADVTKISESMHPFATFKVGTKIYYVYRGNVTDQSAADLLSN